MDQQFWLYFYGMFVASAVHCVTFTSAALDVIGGNFAQATTFVQVKIFLRELFFLGKRNSKYVIRINTSGIDNIPTIADNQPFERKMFHELSMLMSCAFFWPRHPFLVLLKWWIWQNSRAAGTTFISLVNTVWPIFESRVKC